VLSRLKARNENKNKRGVGVREKASPLEVCEWKIDFLPMQNGARKKSDTKGRKSFQSSEKTS
jgi:hypothetical protein